MSLFAISHQDQVYKSLTLPQEPCNYFNMYQLAIEDASNRFFCSLFDKPVPSYVADDIMFMQDKNGNSYKVLSSSAFVRAVEMDPLPSTDPIHRPQGLHKRARITTVVTTKLPPKAAKSTSVVGLQGWPYVVTAGGSRLGYVVTPGSPAALGLSNPPVTTKKTKKTTTVFVHPKTAYQVATTTVNHVSTQYVNQPIPTTVFQPVPTTVVEVELQPTTVTDRGTTAVTKVSDIVLVETVIHTITKATPTSEPSTIYVLSPTTTTVYKTKDCENKTKTKTVRDIITKTVTEVQVVQTEVVVPTTATVTTGPRVTTVLTSRIVWRTKTDGGDE